ncbi:hypothetical protein GQ457_08G028320 [Hibiscus cannabinus]
MIKRYCWKLFVLFRFYARNDQPVRMKKQQYLEVRISEKKGRNIVKVKELKPKRIKDYLEYKFSQKNSALLKYLLFNDFKGCN